MCATVESDISGRTEKLMEALRLPVDRVTESEVKQLQNLIHEFSDVFALDVSELECTDIVHHVINTGDYHPTKQQPYCTPAVYRHKIANIIADMENQGAFAFLLAMC